MNLEWRCQENDSKNYCYSCNIKYNILVMEAFKCAARPMKIKFRDLPVVVQAVTVAVCLTGFINLISLFTFFIKLLLVQIGRL